MTNALLAAISKNSLAFLRLIETFLAKSPISLFFVFGKDDNFRNEKIVVFGNMMTEKISITSIDNIPEIKVGSINIIFSLKVNNW